MYRFILRRFEILGMYTQHSPTISFTQRFDVHFGRVSENSI